MGIFTSLSFISKLNQNLFHWLGAIFIFIKLNFIYRNTLELT